MLAALAGVQPAPQPIPLGAPVGVSQAPSNRREAPVSPAPQFTARVRHAVSLRGGIYGSMDNDPVWNGSPKKGNRRHRSRFNYNR